MTKLKVVQFLPDLDSGGVERGTLELASALIAAGHQSLVVSAGGRMVAELEAGGSQHLTWDLGRKSLLTFRHVLRLRRWLQQQQPDIIHVRSRMPAWIVWLAWRGMNPETRPHFVTTVHGLYSVSRYSAIMTKGERVIAVSNTVRNYIKSNYPKTDMARVTVINRGVDPAEFPRDYAPSPQWLSAWKQQYPQLQGKFVLTLPGRLTRLKGHHDFIDIVQQLKDRQIPVVGLIVGGEDSKRQAYAQELYQRVEAENLSEQVLFTGHRSDMREIYNQSAAVLSLSTKPESFGRTVLEALTQGVPVIGYDHGGVGEILSSLFPAGAVPLRDTEAATQQLQHLYQNPSPRIRGNDYFLLEQMLGQTLKLYMELREKRSN